MQSKHILNEEFIEVFLKPYNASVSNLDRVAIWQQAMI